MVVIVMGPSGAGKSTIGRALAVTLGWPFIEADKFHSLENIATMRRGDALSDMERGPWLDAVHAAIIDAVERHDSVVVACSALKVQYRTVLRSGLREVLFVYLKADMQLLRERLVTRPDHFAGPALATSQLATLEEPHDGALTVDAADLPDVIVSTIQRALAARSLGRPTPPGAAI